PVSLRAKRSNLINNNSEIATPALRRARNDGGWGLPRPLRGLAMTILFFRTGSLILDSYENDTLLWKRIPGL
ncbi:MAG: hypothetical protein ACP5TY_11230, partial [Thermodesulforhabdaceae bacterium]